MLSRLHGHLNNRFAAYRAWHEFPRHTFWHWFVLSTVVWAVVLPFLASFEVVVFGDDFLLGPRFARATASFAINQPRVGWLHGQNQQGYNQQGIAVDPSRNLAFITDASGNRVMVYDLTRLTQGQGAVNVLGQPDFATSSAATTATGLSYPDGIAYDAVHNRLFVADRTNNRVLVYDVSGTIMNQMAAVNVLGQSNFTTAACTLGNQGCFQPIDIAYDAGHDRLFVVDNLNDRILVFDVSTITDGELAVNVLGDTDFVPTQCASYTASCFASPQGIAYDVSHNRLFVGAYGQHRVLVFDAATITDGEPAVNVLGAPDFTSVAFTGPCQRCTYGPIRITYDATNDRIFVDSNTYLTTNIFDVSTITDGEPAIGILGANDYTTDNSCNPGGICCAHNVCGPRGGYYDAVNQRYYGVQFYCCDVNVYSEAAPAPTSVNRPSVPADTPGTVTLTGNYFYDGATVTVGGQPANATFVSQTELTVTLPTELFPRPHDIVVTNPDNQSGTCAACVIYAGGWAGLIGPPAYSGGSGNIGQLGGVVSRTTASGFASLTLPATALPTSSSVTLDEGAMIAAPEGFSLIGNPVDISVSDFIGQFTTAPAVLILAQRDDALLGRAWKSEDLSIYRFDSAMGAWDALTTEILTNSLNLIEARANVLNPGRFALLGRSSVGLNFNSSEQLPSPAILDVTVTADTLTGLPLPNSTLTLSPAHPSGQQLVMMTDARGHVRFSALTPGTYTLILTAPNRRTYSPPSLTLSAGQTMSKNFYLAHFGASSSFSLIPSVPKSRSTNLERQAIKIFGALFRKLPETSIDWISVNYIAYGGTIAKRDLNLERQAIVKFHTLYRRFPNTVADWRLVHVLGYGWRDTWR